MNVDKIANFLKAIYEKRFANRKARDKLDSYRRSQLKSIGVFFMILGIIAILINISKEGYNLGLIVICIIFVVLGFLLFKFRNKIEDYSKYQIRK